MFSSVVSEGLKIQGENGLRDQSLFKIQQGCNKKVDFLHPMHLFNSKVVEQKVWLFKRFSRLWKIYKCPKLL